MTPAARTVVFALLLSAAVVALIQYQLSPGGPHAASEQDAPPPDATHVRYGAASYYAASFDGKTTASGRRFDNAAMLAAHPTYPLGTWARVTNLRNGRFVDVEIVDRGPAAGPRSKGVIVDLSRAAADALGFVAAGHAMVRIDVHPLGRVLE